MTYSSAVLALNPIRYFKLDEASGVVATDASTSSVDGVYSGTPAFQQVGAVDSGFSVDFNGGAALSVGDIPADNSSAFTFSAYISIDAAGQYRTLFSKYDSNSARYEISLGASGEFGSSLGIVVSVGGDSVYTDSIFTEGVFYHVVVVYDGAATTKVKVYIDGVERGLSGTTVTSTTLQALAAGTAYIGSRNGAAPYFDGKIDDVALYDYALSAAQVLTLYSGESSSAATLIAASVGLSGCEIALTFDAAIVANVAKVYVEVQSTGVVYVSSLTGSGTAWTAKLPNRWIRGGQLVTVSYDGGGHIAATNNSAITDPQIGYVGRKFGMFVHYGIETYLNVEWSTGAESINTFAPTANISTGIDSWISGALAAGMRYVVLTAKHHGGFCLWPSATSTRTVAQTPWYAANGSPDILRIYVEKCRAAGLGVGIYFSIWDRWWEANNVGFTYAAYTTYLQSQLTELLTQYGPIECIWFDGWGWVGDSSVPEFAEISYASINNHCKSLQPDCVLIVNNHEDTLANTEIIEYELYVDGQPASGNTHPIELCSTIRGDNAWFYKSAADTHVSASSINSNLSTLNGNRACFLLNCPPDLTGALPAQTLSRLAEVGAATLESVSGISTLAGTLAQRTVSVTLTTNGTTPAANLSGLRWAWWDQATPDMTRPPRAQGTGETTDASGVLSISVPSSLPVSGVGWLVVTNSTGNPAADHNAFSGPVAVS